MEDFGRYEAIEERARGAYGIVYRARDRELDRIVALKTLRSVDAGPLARERFLREARLAARLDHPNIVKIFETGEHAGRPFYTMALVEGEPLRGPVPPAEACRLVSAVADAVAHAHGRGILHRDLKPSNILLCEGAPVVMDFGVARGKDDARLTESGELLGTPAYMAPEQIRGDGKTAGAKADVYALGVLLFELLTGRLPHDGDTFLELSARVLHEPAPELTGFDPALAALVRRCLAKEPGLRPDASVLAEELTRWAPRPRVRWGVPLSILGGAGGVLLWAAALASPEGPRGPMARIPAGAYEVGDPRIGRRAVRLEEFWIDRAEAPSRAGGVSYLEALAACLRQGKRLPSEDEWEVAAGGRLFPWGDEADPSRAACQGVRGSHPRDLSPAGCRDLAGNLAEWTASPGRMGEDYRVVRGGHWQSPIEQCTTWERQEFPVTRRAPTLGYRCASSRPPKS